MDPAERIKKLEECLLRARVIFVEMVEDFDPVEVARETAILEDMNELLGMK